MIQCIPEALGWFFYAKEILKADCNKFIATPGV